jgi:deoxyribonuclease IV
VTVAERESPSGSDTPGTGAAAKHTAGRKTSQKKTSQKKTSQKKTSQKKTSQKKTSQKKTSQKKTRVPSRKTSPRGAIEAPFPGPGDELGAHVSTAGGVRLAPDRAAAVGSVVLQLFTKQPSRWAEPTLTEEDVAAYRAGVERHGIRAASSHDSYLINLASPEPVLRQRSMECFRGELQRCAALGVPFLVTHPGNATDGDFASGIARNAEAVEQLLTDVDGVTVLFETTAGAGRVLGSTFEELADLMGRIDPGLQDRIGVCFDTCHVWAAGYDISVHRIRMFHLNDSVGGLGSRRDRHAGIGEGALGDETFRQLLLDDRFVGVPKVLETPKGDDHTAADRANLARLREYRSGTCSSD